MTTPIVGHQEVHWARPQDTFDTIEAFTAADSVRLHELKLEGGDFEYHASKEKTGSATIETETRGKRKGTFSGKSYTKPNSVGVPPDLVPMILQSYGRERVTLTVLDYTLASGMTVTIVCGDDTVVLTEGVDFNAITSNATTAANLSAAINAAITAHGTLTADHITSTHPVGATDTNVVEGILRGFSIATSAATAIAVTDLRFVLDPSNPPSLQLMKYAGESLCEVASGAVVSTIEYEQKGNEEGAIMFNGEFARKGFLYGAPRTDAAGYTGVAVVNLRANDVKIYDGVRVAFRRRSTGAIEDNGGAGYLVTSVTISSASAEAITLDVNLANPLVAEEYDVIPHVPGNTDAGTIQGGTECDMLVGGTSMSNNEFKLTFETGLYLLDKEHRTDRASRSARKRRVISLEGQGYFLDENAAMPARGWNGTRQTFELRQGPSTAGSRHQLSLPSVRLNVKEVPVPEDEEVVFDFNGFPIMGSAPEDELASVWS